MSKPMTLLAIGDRVRGLRSDFGQEGTVVEIGTHYKDRRGRQHKRTVPIVKVRYDNGGERWASLSRWEKL